MTSIEWFVVLLFTYVFFEDEIETFLAVAALRFFLLWANTNLFVRSYIIYRKLKKGMEDNGLEVPPFQFTPIDKRS